MMTAPNAKRETQSFDEIAGVIEANIRIAFATFDLFTDLHLPAHRPLNC